MMALQRAPGAMLDQPRGAIGALHAMAAVPAQRQRGVAATVEEQHRLLTARQCLGHRGDQWGSQEMAALRGCFPHVDRRNRWHRGATVPGR